jgi:hypothetical protein
MTALGQPVVMAAESFEALIELVDVSRNVRGFGSGVFLGPLRVPACKGGVLNHGVEAAQVLLLEKAFNSPLKLGHHRERFHKSARREHGRKCAFVIPGDGHPIHERDDAMQQGMLVDR